MSDYIYERVTPDHYPLLKELYLDAFNSKIDVSEIQKRFDTSELGCKHIGFIAIIPDSKKIAAYYGVFPVKIKIRDEIIQSAQSGDTMTHSLHRGKGLFVKLANLTYNECRKNGIRLIFGQPNRYSFHGLVNSLKWKHLDNLCSWDLKLRIKTFPLPKLMRIFKANKPYLQYAKRVMKRKQIQISSSFDNTLSTDHGKVVRDKSYLEYKKSPDKFFIKMEGVIIWIRLTDVLWIGDFSSYEVNPGFIKSLKRLAYWLGYNTIRFNLNESIPLPAALKSFECKSLEASCFLYLDQTLSGKNLTLTGADFDTW